MGFKQYYITIQCTFLSVFMLNGQEFGLTAEALGFDPGEIQEIVSPDAQHIESFVIPTFRGLLRLGQQRIYYSRQLDRNEFARTSQQRKDLEYKLKDGLISYFSLVNMEAGKETIDLNKIRASFRPGTALEDNNSQYAKSVDSYWAIILKGLGAKHLKPETYTHYFCPEQQACLPIHMPKSSAAYQQKIRRTRWAGGTSEFAEMRVFNEFMDKQATHFVNWSEGKIPEEAYIVGRTSLGEYNFNAGGFVLKGLKEVNIGPVQEEYNVDTATSLFKPNYQPEGQPYQAGILISMSPEKAEAFLKKLNSSGRSRQLYYVYKVRIRTRFSEEALNNTDFHKMVTYAQEPASRTIEFFSDDALTNKVLEISN